MRGNGGFWGMCAVLLGVLFVLAGNATAYDISGTVSNNTGKSGRIYLSVQYSGGGGTGLGVSIPSAGPYTIRGVPSGSYSVQGFVDTQTPEAGIRHASDPVGYSAPVNVSGANVASADIALKDPSPAILSSPRSAQAMPGDGLAFVMWDPARSNDSAEAGRYYTVYWSDTPNPGPANFKGKSADLPSSRNTGYVATGLGNGKSYYFAVSARLTSGGTESAPTNANGGAPVAVGSVSVGYKVSGTLDCTGIGKSSTTPLWVAAALHDKGPVAFSYIANPANLQSYSIAGVPPGTYQLYAILDMNNNGIIDAGDYMTADGKATSITVSNADLTGADFSLAQEDTDVSVSTGHWGDAASPLYSLDLAASAVHKLPVNVAVTGPQLGGTIDMAPDNDGGGRFRSWAGVPNRPQVAPTPDSYSFLVSYADGSSTSPALAAQVTGVLDGYATPTAPIGTVQGGTPTFTWSAPSTPPASSFAYRVEVDGNGMHWSSQAVPSSQLSLTYAADGTAPALMPGTEYRWSVDLTDSHGNSAGGTKASFTVASVSGSASGTYGFNPASGLLSLTWLKSDFVCEGPKLGTENDSVTTLSGTTLIWVDPNDSTNTMTWTRSAGTVGDIVGTWSATESKSNNSYVLTFNGDGTMSASGTVSQCGGTSAPSALAQVVNSTGTPLYQVMVGNTPFSDNLSLCGDGCSTGFFTVPGGSYPVSVRQTAAASQVQAGSLGIPGSGPGYSVNVRSTVGGYCAELWQRGDTVSTFNNDTAKFLIGSTCSGGPTGNSPAISSFTPTSGAVGSTVTIYGSNFDQDPANDRVTFNGVAATVTSASSTQLVTTVPAGASNGPISLFTNGSTVSTPAPFQVVTGPISISGFVKSSAGSGIAGVTVGVVENGALSALSASDGSFTIGNIPAAQPCTLTASASGSNAAYLGPFNSTVNLTGKNVVLYTLGETSGWGLLSGKGAIAGRVMDSVGNPLADAVVSAASSLHPDKPYPVSFYDGTGWGGSATLSSGKYLVLNVDAGDTVTLNAANPQWNFPTKKVQGYADAVSEISFSGTGSLPPSGYLSVSPMSVYFNDATGSGNYQPQTITFTNSGAGNLTVQSAVLTGGATGDASSFSLQPGAVNPCPQLPHTFAPNESCTLTASFTPVGSGPKYASLQVNSDSPGNPALFVGLNGYAPSLQGSIAGKVTDGSGTPLPWVNVQALDVLSNLSFYVNTDVDGNYLLSVPGGSYKVQFTYYAGQTPTTVWFDKATTQESATPVTVSAPNATSGVNAVINTAGAGTLKLSGRLLDAGGQGVCGANIYASGPNGSASARTGGDGSYALFLAAGDYSVSVNYYYASPSCGTVATYPQYSGAAQLTLSADQTHDFSLPQAYTVTGKVVEEDGTPVPGAGINFSAAPDKSSTGTTPGTPYLSAYTTSGTDGSYSINLYAGTYSVRISQGSSNLTAATGFVVDGNLSRDFTSYRPVVAGFSPTSGQGGERVTIAGSGFGAPTEGNSVSFGGMYAPIVTWNDTQIVVTIPYGAPSGPISVNVQGSSFASSQSFTVMIVPPKVAHTVPAADAAAMPANGGIFVSFDKEMDRSSINPQSFTVKDGSGAAVSGAVQERDNSYVFVPAAALGFGKGYTATLSTGVRSMDGAALSAPYSWSFSTAQAPGNSFALKGGIYSLEATHENGADSFFYDVVRLGADGSQVTDSWYSWLNGGWSSTAPLKKDEGYSLTDNGWQLVSDSPENGTVTENSDGTFTWTNSADKSAQLMEPVEYSLAGQPLSAYADPADLPAPPTGSFPEGSFAYLFRTTALTDSYHVGVWNKDPGSNADQNYVRYYDATGEHVVTVLTELPERFAPGQYNNWLNSNGNIGMQLAGDNTVQLFQFTPQEMSLLSATGTWEYATVKGERLLVVHLPDAAKNGQQSELFYALVNGVVKQGEWTHAGTQEIDTNPNYNQTAFDWMIGAAPPVPVAGNQSIGGMSFALATVKVGGTTQVSAAGGPSGNPVVFSTLTPVVCSVSGSTVSALSAGTCTIAANQAGNASYNAAPQVTKDLAVGAAAPGAPVGVGARGGDAQATVSFGAPGFDGGSAIIGYTVTSIPGGITATGTESPITVKGLLNGTSYTFTVTAANAQGSGAPSAPSPGVLVATVPGTPGSVSASVGSAHATVSFAAPQSNGGSTITGYTVVSTPGSISATGTASPIVVDGLMSGTAYTFTVTATNLIGKGQPSAPSNSVTPDSVPGAPSAVGASAGNAEAQVSFTPPAPNGGSAITGYTVTSLPGNITASGAMSPITIGGLANGTAYTFTVTAKNGKGAGAPSAPSNSVTPDVVPGAPTGVSATHGNASTMVSFIPPQQNGGTPVKYYTVTSTPGNLSASGAASPITVTGLNNGTAYTFTVTASNGKGAGAPSAPSEPVTPSADVPGAPLMGKAVGGNGTATVTFSAPASNGGSAITGYTVSSTPAGGIDGDAGTLGTVHTVSGLANGTAYTFTVTATNGAGSSAASAASNSVVPVTVPGAPLSVSASAEHALARVSFSAPLSNGGSAILRYTVTSTPGSVTASGSASPITVSGLTDGTSYTFTVTATSAAGTGAPSAPSDAVTPADSIAPVVRSIVVPGSASAENGVTSVTLPVSSFYATDAVGVAGYLITESSAKPAADAGGWSRSAPTSYAIGTAAGAHTVYAWAKDAAGNVSAPYSGTVVVTPKDTIPPVILSGPTVTSLSNNMAVVEWQTNEPALGGVKFGPAPSPAAATTESEYRTSHSLTLNGLSADTTYYVSVFATDQAGNGPVAGREISLHTKPAPDTVAPYITEGPSVASIGPDGATVQWRTNEPAQGQVMYGTANTLGLTAGEAGFSTAHSVRLTGLSAETLYYLKVNGADIAGNGPRESGMTSFKTVALPDTTPPVLVERPMALNISDTSATVLWKTDEPTTGVVMTVDGGNYGFFSDNTLSTRHSVTLTGLTGSKGYQYKVISTDGSGNSMITNFGTFATTAAADTTAPVIIEGPLVVDVTYQSAALRWSTDEPSDSVVEYGTSANFGSADGDSALVRTHNLTLTGLEAGTTYYFRVRSTDAFGNGPTSSKVFTVTTALDPSYKVPVITVAPTVIYKTDSSMTVYWETDDPSDSVVEYGEGSTLTDRVSNSEKVIKHQITITNLKKSTSYKVVVSSTNMSGNTVYAKAGGAARFLALNLDAVYSDAVGGAVPLGAVSTGADADIAAPLISDAPTVSGITDIQAVVSWTTDEIADSQVSYGVKGGSATLSAGDTAQVTKHVVVLTNLSANTTYAFTVSSTDPSGNGPTSSAPVEFTTAGTPDTAPPVFVVSNPSDPQLGISFQDGTGKTTLGWTTDEPATTQIRYGLSPDAMNSQGALPGLSQSHSLTLALQPGTTYYAAAVAIDGSGNVSQSSTLTFSTLGTVDDTEPTTTATPGEGSYLGPKTVALSADKPSNIYYTTDGSTPTTSSAQYNGPIVVAATKTVKFFAIDGSGNREVPKAARLVIQYGVSATSDQHGTISCPAAVNYGESATCTVTPNTGYQVAQITGCGGSASGSGYLTGAVTAECSVSATFTPITFTVTPALSGHGTISPAVPQTVSFGAGTSFTVAPGVGYRLGGVTGCGGTLSGTTYTVASPSGNCTVNASFVLATPTGDLNLDGKVDIADAVRALQMSVQLIIPTADDLALDVGPLMDGKPAPDGKIDFGDALLILKKTVGILTW